MQAYDMERLLNQVISAVNGITTMYFNNVSKRIEADIKIAEVQADAIGHLAESIITAAHIVGDKS